VTFAVEFMPAAAKQLATLDRQTRLRVVGAIELLSIDPRPPGATMLRGGARGVWRIRVGSHRVVYSIDDGRLTVLVVRVAHRSEAYG